MTTWPIDSLTLPTGKARIGLCAYPGQSGSLDNDVRQLRDWGARGLLTLLEQRELELLGVTSMPTRIRAAGMRWWHLPIRDMHTPDADFEVRWAEVSRELHALFVADCAIAVHCRGGKGRTGTIAARLLVELGMHPGAAIERVRSARPGSIETAEQEDYVHACGAGP